MKICLVHNRYQHPGGEDQVFLAEGALLQSRGQEISAYTIDNRAVSDMNPVVLAGATIWNVSVYRALRRWLERERPDVVHFHNTFPLISPAAYYAARRAGVPVVQTLHNFRLLCPNALFFRDGRACEDCLTRLLPWPGVVHACYRNSRSATAVTAAMLGLHRLIGTWSAAVDTYIALTEFARHKFVQGGLPADRIVVKPNCLSEDPGVGDHLGGYALFVGRLSPEKGLGTLLEAWDRLANPVPLRIIGSGPLEECGQPARGAIEWMGWQPREEVLAAMRQAAFLIVPSEWYEAPMTVLEGFATGLPVIASAQGPHLEVIRNGVTGLHFKVGDPAELAAKVAWATTHGREMREMGCRGREEFEARYTADRNYDALTHIYHQTASTYATRVLQGVAT